ncbi:uncharacterized protein LOC122853833 [Aphidius gifuensis]|uniref:uncharacterized protein LOC122853833 n=1 Tax=Aphidius gifuensis TaxID=684658 RepID=UPI001CDD61AD|nr:uncharacterized protein LOC122853833 [Aphidius gifuensis]
MGKTVRQLIIEQAELINNVEVSLNRLDKTEGAKTNKHIIRGYLENMRNYFALAQNNHQALLLAKEDGTAEDQAYIETKKYFTSECFYRNLEPAFLRNQAEMTARIEAIEKLTDKPIIMPTSESRSYLQFPKVQITPFNGNIEEWSHFKDLFETLVLSKPGIPDVEKFTILNNSLVGTAATHISYLKVTEANFAEAWKALVSFYENKRLFIDAHISTLLSIKRVPSGTSDELQKLLSTCSQVLAALKALKRPTDTWDDLLIGIVKSKLDSGSIGKWEESVAGTCDPPTWDDLKTFLTTRIRYAKSIELSKSSYDSELDLPSTSRHQQGKDRLSKGTIAKSAAHSHHAAGTSNCHYCNEPGHFIAFCPSFEKKTFSQRQEYVRKKFLCQNCLGKHKSADCKSDKRCKMCDRAHHTLLHTPKSSQLNASSSTKGGSDNPSGTTSQGSTQGAGALSAHMTRQIESVHDTVLLATLDIFIISQFGERQGIRALLDQGSEISICTERIIQCMHISRSRSELPILGVGSTIQVSKGSARLSIQSSDKTVTMEVDVSILPKITSYTPVIGEHQDWPEIKKLKLADPGFNEAGTIELLLGANIYGKILKSGVIQGPVGVPTAQNTVFGWILSGVVTTRLQQSPKNTLSIRQSNSLHCRHDTELNKILQKFWQQENEFFSLNQCHESEDSSCQDHFDKTHTRDATGRYIVRLPFLDKFKPIGNTYTPALKMLERQENKMSQDKSYQTSYQEFLLTYEQMGHMQLRPFTEDVRYSCFLPHHGVVKESSTSTKLRVVFNASFKPSGGTSLNDLLHEGPKLLNNLVDVIMRWRQYQFVFAADVQMMFRQIKLHEDDWKYQQILWRKSKTDEVKTYLLTTVTYGTRPAPFLALATMKQLEKDEGSNFPEAANVISEGSYMDDVFSGAHSRVQCMTKIEQTMSLFKAGGFTLKKWLTNDIYTAEVIPKEDRQDVASSLSFEGDEIYRALGLSWNKDKDSFTYGWTQKNTLDKMTKRTAASLVAQLFDPLGWVTPITVSGKILMQNLWASKIGWDDELDPAQLKLWQDYQDQLGHLSKIEIPRWLGTSINNKSSFEIHGFADASNVALGAVVYIKVIDEQNNVRTNIVTAKSKAVPLSHNDKKKTKLTTPRLELSAAVCLVRLVEHVQAALKMERICQESSQGYSRRGERKFPTSSPGHFLIGRPLNTLPEPSLLDLKTGRLDKWQLVQQLTQSLWKRWSTEYLHQFYVRAKWSEATTPVKIGDIVLLTDERQPCTKWPLAKIIDTHPGDNGLPRVVTLKTATSTFKRPVVKLCVLPVEARGE